MQSFKLLFDSSLTSEAKYFGKQQHTSATIHEVYTAIDTTRNGQSDKGSKLENKDHVETRSHTKFKESTGEIWRGHHRPSRDPMALSDQIGEINATPNTAATLPNMSL
uniref:Uncharacterized protein n=1 Tax=Megaselia scalaris TaxID=36166 RepID=T1GY95_MEGSC